MRQWSHYTIEDKRAAVAALAAGNSARAVERATGIDHHLLASWRASYQEGGTAALANYQQSRRYPPALKAQVRAEYQTGTTSLRALCRKYNISNPGLCSKWVNSQSVD